MRNVCDQFHFHALAFDLFLYGSVHTLLHGVQIGGGFRQIGGCTELQRGRVLSCAERMEMLHQLAHFLHGAAVLSAEFPPESAPQKKKQDGGGRNRLPGTGG